MAGWLGQRDWDSALSRWLAEGLIEVETAESIRAWELQQASAGRGAAHGRAADAAAYLGVSIVVLAVFLLSATSIGEDAFGWAAFSAAAGVVGIGASWFARGAGSAALSDAGAAAAVVLIAFALGIVLDEVGSDDQFGAGWAAVAACAALVGGLMFRLVGSRLALFAAAASLAAMPAALAVDAGALEAGIFRYDGRSLDGWQSWATLWLTALLGAALLWGAGHARRWFDPVAARWGRLGASLGAAVVVLGLAGASGSPLMDWAVLLIGWGVTGWALQAARIELLPASALLLIGALAGGLSDLQDEARLGLSIVVLLTAFQLTALGLAGPRLTGRLADHWLTPLWEAVLLGAGVPAASIFAAESAGLAALGMIWALALFAVGIVREHRVAFVFGVIGIYAAGLTLVVGEFESSLAAVVGTLAFGVLVVLAGIVWRRRFRRRGAD